MNYDTDHMTRLILDELTNIITPQDRELLYRHVRENKEVAALREHLREMMTTGDMEGVLENPGAHMPVSEIFEDVRLKRQKKRRLIIAGLATAAVAALLIVRPLFLSSPEKPVTAVANIPAAKKVILQLSETTNAVYLNEQEAPVKIGENEFYTSRQTLSWPRSSRNQSTGTILYVPAGRDFNLKLDDGTAVQINATSKIRFPIHFTGNTREVSIEGEAFFKVAHDPSRPFIVHTPTGSITVLGTEFNVNTYNKDEVAVVTGKVQVHSANFSALLEKEQMAVRMPDGSFNVQPLNRDKLSWKEGIFIYKHATLREVSDLITRCYGIKVVSQNPLVDEITLTGALQRSEPIDSFLVNNIHGSSIKYSFDKDSILCWK